MRSPALALAVFTFACGSSKDKDPAPTPPPTPSPEIDHGAKPGSGGPEMTPVVQKKKPIDAKPLPPLTKDPGGATGKVGWVTGFGGLGTESPRGIAMDPSGDIYIAGIFDAEMVVGDQKFKAAGDGSKTDAFVMKLGADGKPTWTKTFGATRDDTANGIAVHGDTIVVVGNYLDELKIGKFPAHKSVGSDDLYVAAFDKTGEVRWLWTAGGVDSDGANAVAATPDGGWIVGGSFADSIELPNRTLKSKGGTDAILVKLAPGGDLEWVKQFGGRGNDTISHVAVDGQGNIIVQGQFKGISDWGGTPLKAGGGSDLDVVLAKYDLNGDHLWSQRFGDALNDVAGGVTVDPAGFITMVGSFDRRVSFGTGDDHTSLGESDAFVARFAPDGKLAWAHTYGAEREDIAFGVAADAAGNVVASGYFQNLIDFGKGAATHSHGNKDVFVVKFDVNGNVVWWQTFGDHDHDQGRAVAMDDKGNAYITGLYRFTLTLGATPLESTRAEGDRIPKPDVFVVKLER